jgi:hypothetical protein
MVLKAKSCTVRFFRIRSDTVLRRRRPDEILGPDQRHGLVECGRVMWVGCNAVLRTEDGAAWVKSDLKYRA